MAGQLDYKVFFRKTESGFNVDPYATFEVPPKFYERVSRVMDKFRAGSQPQTQTMGMVPTRTPA